MVPAPPHGPDATFYHDSRDSNSFPLDLGPQLHDFSVPRKISPQIPIAWGVIFAVSAIFAVSTVRRPSSSAWATFWRQSRGFTSCIAISLVLRTVFLLWAVQALVGDFGNFRFGCAGTSGAAGAFQVGLMDLLKCPEQLWDRFDGRIGLGYPGGWMIPPLTLLLNLMILAWWWRPPRWSACFGRSLHAFLHQVRGCGALFGHFLRPASAAKHWCAGHPKDDWQHAGLSNLRNWCGVGARLFVSDWCRDFCASSRIGHEQRRRRDPSQRMKLFGWWIGEAR